MGTRLLTGFAVSLFAAGCALNAVGLDPALHNAELSRLGLLAAVVSLPAWITVASRRAAKASRDQLTDAREAGYVLAMRHVEEAAGRPVRIPRPQGTRAKQERHGQ